VLGPLQDVEPTGPLGILLIILLLAGGSDFVGAADNSARVIALMATAAGRLAGSIHFRKMTILVSSSPCG
jgi:hypothetical protein